MKTDFSDTWDGRCLRCGCCCFEKLEFEGEIYYTDEPCQFLDLRTRLCTQFEHRTRVRPGCVPVDAKVIAAGILPAHCAYVRGIRDYPAPHANVEGLGRDFVLDEHRESP